MEKVGEGKNSKTAAILPLRSKVKSETSESMTMNLSHEALVILLSKKPAMSGTKLLSGEQAPKHLYLVRFQK
jgi:hypothetical protein